MQVDSILMPQNVLYQEDIPDDVLARYQHSRLLAIDTETTGLNHQRDRLCLVQLTDEHSQLSLIQIQSEHAPNLKALLEDETKTKIFHFARFDVAVLRHRLGIRFANLFCTKIASKLVRTYTDKHGLKDLVREFFGEELNKNEQTSDWGKLALSPEQLVYAAGDVRYLVALRDHLAQMLQREGREALAQACFAYIPTQVEFDLLHWNGILDH